MRLKYYLLGMTVMGMLTACSGEKKESADNGVKDSTEKKVEADQPTGDVFIYNGEHRRNNTQPDKAKVLISKTLASINTNEFAGNTTMEEIWIGEQVQHIANGAFENCTNLKKIHLAGPLPVINDGAFTGCTSLKELKGDVYTIGIDGFKGCTSLQSVILGEHAYWIRVGAFFGCKNLKKLILADTMSKLEDGAFEGCTSMEELSIPNDFKNRMFGMFSNPEKLRKVYLLTTEFYPMPKNCQPNKQCTLYVPDAFVEQFKADAEWSQFGSIEPTSKSAYYTAEGFLK
jgi:hypothetical protein